MKFVEKQLTDIISSWFYSEPLLFSTICTHNLVENAGLAIPMRCGNLRIEYSPDIVKQLDSNQMEAYLKIEAYRILLQHPYTRQPYNCKKSILFMASDCTIARVFPLPEGVSLLGVEYMKSKDPAYARAFESPGKNQFMYEDLSFEEWYRKLYSIISKAKNGDNAGDEGNFQDSLALAEASAELWEENEEVQNNIKDDIKKAEVDMGWGGLGGDSIRSLKEECDFSFDYRRALTQFRQSIISANRSLTRMRPSRRYGFKAMGSRYERKANIVIAVDVSGSITDESFAHFSYAINNFFFLGIIEKIDLIFFDTNLKNTQPISFKEKLKLEEIQGRGGTNFQPAINFYESNFDKYNGMIIFTDGEGELPQFSKKGNILWIMDSRLAFERSKAKIETSGCGKVTYLPF